MYAAVSWKVERLELAAQRDPLLQLAQVRLVSRSASSGWPGQHDVQQLVGRRLDVAQQPHFLEQLVRAGSAPRRGPARSSGRPRAAPADAARNSNRKRVFDAAASAAQTETGGQELVELVARQRRIAESTHSTLSRSSSASTACTSVVLPVPASPMSSVSPRGVVKPVAQVAQRLAVRGPSGTETAGSAARSKGRSRSPKNGSYMGRPRYCRYSLNGSWQSCFRRKFRNRL